MFGRATITLGIGPHSSCCLVQVVLVCAGDLYSRINAQRGVFFPEEQVSAASVNNVYSVYVADTARRGPSH